jgi:hypothetical protein
MTQERPQRFSFVAEYSTRDPAGNAWIDVLGGYAERMASAWHCAPGAEVIELRFATAEQRKRLTDFVWAIEHVRPSRLYDEST